MDFLKNLKAETASIHQKIEKETLFSRIISKKITLIEYIKLLSILYDFISKTESVIHKKYPHLLLGREKTTLLREDLRMHGGVSENSLFVNDALINNEQHVWGYLYVIEGSTLGGQICIQYLKKNVQLPTDISMCYFDAYGKDTRKSWDFFLKLLIDANLSLKQQKNVIDNANNVFEKLFNLTKLE